MEEKKNYIASVSGLKGKDYLAYALGDVGCCLVFGLIITIGKITPSYIKNYVTSFFLFQLY